MVATEPNLQGFNCFGVSRISEFSVLDLKNGRCLVSEKLQRAMDDLRFKDQFLFFKTHVSDIRTEYYQFDPRTGHKQLVHSLPSPRENFGVQIESGTFSPNGEWIFYQEDVDVSRVQLFNVKERRVVSEVILPSSSVAAKIGLDQEGKRMTILFREAQHDNKTIFADRIRIISFPDGKILHDLLLPHDIILCSLDGNDLMLVGFSDDSKLRWLNGWMNLETGKLDWKRSDILGDAEDRFDLGGLEEARLLEGTPNENRRFQLTSRRNAFPPFVIELEANQIPRRIVKGMLVSVGYKKHTLKPWMETLNEYSSQLLKRVFFPPFEKRIVYHDLQTGKAVARIKLHQAQGLGFTYDGNGATKFVHFQKEGDKLVAEVYGLFPVWTPFRILGLALVLSGVLWWCTPWRIITFKRRGMA